MSIIEKESILNGYPEVISYNTTKKIIEQMEKYICKINIGNKQGTGFFCKIPILNIPTFITNNHIINEDILKSNKNIYLDIEEESEPKLISLNDNRMKYTNEEYDITIIEIKEKDNINNYLELDDLIFNDILNNINKNSKYKNETIYIIQYPKNKLSVSYGIVKDIYSDKKYNFNHLCSTESGSSGSPILNIYNKLIGIHKEGKKNNYNIATFLNYPIKEFIHKYNNNKIYNNNINVSHNNNKKVDDEKLLQEFNIKYNVNLKLDTKEINLRNHNIGDEGLKDLCKIKFKELKELRLRYNNISDINALEKAKFSKLEHLALSDNEITDINILEKVNFKELKELYLNNNKISDINILEKVNFNKLEKLGLGSNKISDINILENVNFKELNTLWLYSNKISDIKVLEKVKFNKLQALELNNNCINYSKNNKIISNLISKFKDFIY